MNAEIKAKWVAALRSGEYKQGRGCLAIRDMKGTISHCCLGVLCELAVQENVIRKPLSEMHIVYAFEDKILPDKVRVWAGLNSNDPWIGGDVQALITQVNDKGVPFEHIANLIEDYL